MRTPNQRNMTRLAARFVLWGVTVSMLVIIAIAVTLVMPRTASAQPATKAQQIGISNMVMEHCLPAMQNGVCRAFNEAERSPPPVDGDADRFLGNGLGTVTKAQFYSFVSDPNMCKRLEVAARADWASVDARIGRSRFRQTPNEKLKGR
jgi:hypothetical protein